MKLEQAVSPVARKRSRFTGLRAIAVVLLFCSGLAGAAPLTLTIANPDRISLPGASEIFSGTITNNTGASLNASDLFLDFAGYDAVQVTLTQLLGASDFSIADGATSSFTDLFRFDLGAAAPVPATFFADVVVQDANNDFSDVATVSVRTVTEPGAPGLAGLALIAGWLSRRGRRPQDRPASALPRSSAAERDGGSSC